MEIKKYKTLSEWYQEIKSQGYSVPPQICIGIQEAMKELDMGFAEVFELFVERAIIIQAEKAFIYDMWGYKRLVPKGLYRCEKCGEYKGVVKAKDLDWDYYFDKPAMEEKEEDIIASCLCDGILCPKCKKNKVRRPISNHYDIESNTIDHSPWFMGMMGCGECRKRKNS